MNARPLAVASDDDGRDRHVLAHDLFLPTLLFAALGGMSWAVRGCSGFGAVPGCLFAGVTWGAAWWYIAQTPGSRPARRYASGWVIAAITFGVGISGARGWMQWPSFFDGRLQTDTPAGQFVPISPSYGFLWLFIAGVPWAGLGACVLAWTGSLRETRVWHWVIRIACGVGGSLLLHYLFTWFPQYFLPLYGSVEERYKDLEHNPNLGRLIGDCDSALTHLGYYLGFLLYEVGRKDWKNVVLITTVGLVNGAGWSLLQNWSWAHRIWPEGKFNFWRCWESSGGISIGIAYGIAYFLVNRRMSDKERTVFESRRSTAGADFEWLLVYFGLASWLSLWLRPQMTGWAFGLFIQPPADRWAQIRWAQIGSWGNVYFTIVLAFGAAYYLRSMFSGRGSAVDGLVGVGIAGVLIAGLFYSSWFFAEARSGGREARQAGREMMRYLPLGLVGVMAVGCAWYFFRRGALERKEGSFAPSHSDPNLERLGVYLGLLAGLGLSLRNGLKGWFNIYKGNERDWSEALWQYLGPVYLVCLVAIVAWLLFRPARRDPARPLVPGAYGLMWLVLIVQNAIAQLITGPLTQWTEAAFSIYYVLLFFPTAVIVFHFHIVSARRAESEGPPAAADHESQEPAVAHENTAGASAAYAPG
jgi:hypothetical protein